MYSFQCWEHLLTIFLHKKLGEPCSISQVQPGIASALYLITIYLIWNLLCVCVYTDYLKHRGCICLFSLLFSFLFGLLCAWAELLLFLFETESCYVTLGGLELTT